MFLSDLSDSVSLAEPRQISFSTTEETYKVGTLVVDLFDTNTKKLIWHGSASDTLSDKSDKNIKTLNSDVQRMFDHFPPEVKK